MAFSLAMSVIVDRGFKRADQENDDHVSSTERKMLVGEVYNELHRIVSGTGCRYFETEATITATGATSYALPSAWKSTLSVEYVIDSSDRRRPLRGPVPLQRQHHFTGLTGTASEFALAGGNIYLLPVPSTGTYKHRYIPQPTDYSAAQDSDTIDLVNSDGASFMFWSLACLGKDKSESDLRYAETRRQHFAEELQVWAAQMAFTENASPVAAHDDHHSHWPYNDLLYFP